MFRKNNKRRKYSMPNHSYSFPQVVWWIVVGGIICLYFFGLDFVPLLGPDEPRYSQIAREMFERGDWLTPTLGQTNWFEKPALLYWLQIVAYNIFGVSEFSARFFSAVFGVLTVLVVYRLCIRIENLVIKKGYYSQNSTGLAKFTAISLATSIGLIAFSRGASFDIILSFPITLALVCFFTFEIYSPHTRREEDFHEIYLSDLGFLAGFYIFIGVALLAKGLIGIVIPFGVVFTYYFFQFRLPSRIFFFSLFVGIPISLAVASSWYVPMYLQHGFSFIDEFFIQHHFQRYVSNKYLHPQPFWFFWLILPAMTLPWLPFLLTSVWNIKNWRSGEGQIPSDYLRVFALAWLLFPLFFFTFSGSKLPGYILPALPGAMILIGDRLRRMVNREPKNEWLVFGLSSGMIILCFITLFFFVKGFASHETVKYLMETANSQGFKEAKVFNLHTVSHNAEFYSAGRLIRQEDGKIKRFEGVSDIVEEMKAKKLSSALVLVPLEYQSQLNENETFSSNVLADNGELAIVAINLKDFQSAVSSHQPSDLQFVICNLRFRESRT